MEFHDGQMQAEHRHDILIMGQANHFAMINARYYRGKKKKANQLAGNV